MSELEARIAFWNQEDDQRLLKGLRHEVFVVEQQVPIEMEWDQLDEDAVHVLVYAKNEAIGCARLIPNNDALKVGRVGVLSHQRGLGAGHFLMEFVRNYAEQEGYTKLYLEAQTQAYNFYRHCGYEAQSLPFDDCNIPHILMERPVVGQSEIAHPPKYASGEDHERYNLHGLIEQRAFCELQLQQCRRILQLQWKDWDHPILQLDYWKEAFLHLAKRHARTQIHLLMSEPGKSQDNHPFLVLRDRLSSRVELKFTDQPVENCILFDLHGFYYVNGKDGCTSFGERARVKQHSEDFGRLWEKARVPHEVRRLYL